MLFTNERQKKALPERRPSQARIRKSISKSSSLKQVTWCPAEECVHRVENHYEGVDHDAIWYSREELRAIRSSNEYLVSDYCTSQDDTLRGLESWTDQGSWERYEHHRDCLNKVLDEQDRQNGVDKTEFQLSPSPLVKRINHLHMEFDHDRLGALCRDATAKARRAAMLRGRKDYKEARKQDIKAKVQEQEQEQEQEKAQEATKPVAPEKPEAGEEEEDDRTVTTEASTAVESHDATAPTEADPVPVPTAVVVVTAQSLLAARYANYLASRQQRLDARERADYEWEQRKLARRASYRQKHEQHFEKMQRLVEERNQLLALVSAR